MERNKTSVSIPISEGDAIGIDDTIYRVVEISEGEIQLTMAGNFIDATRTPEELEEDLEEANSIYINK